jgi:hypothetical protein
MAVLSTLRGDESALLQSHLDNLLWDAINRDSPTWFLHPINKTVFNERSILDDFSASSPFKFAPGLIEALGFDTPPSVQWLKSLPAPNMTALVKHWGIYVHIYEKDGRTPRLYIGSGTDAYEGVGHRLACYDTGRAIPRHIRIALKQGFRKTCTRLLATSQSPPAGLMHKSRQRYLGIEGIFQMIFFASFKDKMEASWIASVPWAREDVGWLPLCSHISLSERARGDLDLPLEVLEELAANHKVSRAEMEKASLNNTREAGKHKCSVCGGRPFTKPYLLKRHYRTQAHKRNVALVGRGGVVKVSAAALTARKLTIKAKETKRFYCSTCDKPFGRAIHLECHYNTKKHAHNATIADAELDAAVSDSDDLHIEGLDSEDEAHDIDGDATDAILNDVQEGDSMHFDTVVGSDDETMLSDSTSQLDTAEEVEDLEYDDEDTTLVDDDVQDGDSSTEDEHPVQSHVASRTFRKARAIRVIDSDDEDDDHPLVAASKHSTDEVIDLTSEA